MLQDEIDQNLSKFENFIYFDLSTNFDQFQPVTFKVDLQTTKFVHFWNQRAICNQKK
jgi:hypothetical protein